MARRTILAPRRLRFTAFAWRRRVVTNNGISGN
jgi:hypothetical protein